VANTRVDQHVEKGNDDGLYISSVACCQELWALIMDAGTGFTAQTYCLSNQFLPKEWIMVSPAGEGQAGRGKALDLQAHAVPMQGQWITPLPPRAHL